MMAPQVAQEGESPMSYMDFMAEAPTPRRDVFNSFPSDIRGVVTVLLLTH